MTVHPAIVDALQGYEPTSEQWKAIEYPAAPLSIVAGAGSGKTAVMAARIAHLVLTGGTAPAQVLGLTFTNKAAGELEERVRRALKRLPLASGEEASVFTYHGFADRVIRDYGPKIGIEPEIALMSPAQSYMLIARLLEELTFENLKVSWLPSVIAKIGALADTCANHLVAPEAVIAADREMRESYEREDKAPQRRLGDTLVQRPEIAKAVRAYIDRKRELGRIDYGDQIAFAYRLVDERPEVAAALRERWPVVLLDEYQDTNVAQRKMMRSIYPGGSPITVVGDPDQAIYAWRGATLHNILQFPQHFPAANGAPAETKPLQVSFRSAERILRVADAVISKIPAGRRGTNKVLNHHPATGQGDVTCDLLESEADEAELIARDIEAMTSEDGPGLDGSHVSLDEIAILCRGRRLFPAVQQALRDKGIPVEVVGLGGLLTVPEVVDLLAHLRLAVRPGDNVSFARIALGPKWRVGVHDLAALARWAAVHTRQYQKKLEERDVHGGEVDPGDERFSLSEALGRLDEVPDLSDEAQRRLLRLHAHTESLRAHLRGCTLAEAVELALGYSGIEDELALADTSAAHAARANVNALLDEAHSFSPLEGEASVPAFLDYLDSALGVQDLELAQPQQANSVKLMTMHGAKGLEFDVVFVPGMADRMFPDARVTEDPTRSTSELPHTVREDAESLPRFEGNMSRFHDALAERAMEDERRLAYVALTRARKALRLSAAHWYGRDRKKPAGPGRFFLELAGAPASDEGEEVPAHPAVTVRSYAGCPESNPIRSDLEERARTWPRPTPEVADPLFERGWRQAAEQALAGASVEDMAQAAKVDAEAFARAKERTAHQLQLVTTPAVAGAPDERLRSLSVSSIVQLARCPKQFYWTVVRPLPRRPSSAARLGQEIHRWIEVRSIGQGRLDDPEEMADVTPDELRDDLDGRRAGRGDASPESLRRSFESSPYASMTPRFVEQPFVLALDGGFLVRGRMDAVYVRDDATWEIVDFKTGREPDASDSLSELQLTVYALAAQQIWAVDPARLEVSYLYLRSGKVVTMRAADLALSEADLVAMFHRLESEELAPTPSAICHSCDYLRFCAAGRAHVSEAAASEAAASETAASEA
ncbi:ATP-dependent DNA helicase AdnB [soil metagenome]